MKKQEEILPEEIFPELEGVDINDELLLFTKGQQMDKFLFNLQSVRLGCPVCHELHTENEMILQNHICNGVKINYKMTFYGDTFFTIAPNQKLTKVNLQR